MKKVFIEYKFPDRPWVVFDSTVVKSWAKIQNDRMRQEFPGADYRVRKESK